MEFIKVRTLDASQVGNAKRALPLWRERSWSHFHWSRTFRRLKVVTFVRRKNSWRFCFLSFITSNTLNCQGCTPRRIQMVEQVKVMSLLHEQSAKLREQQDMRRLEWILHSRCAVQAFKKGSSFRWLNVEENSSPQLCWLYISLTHCCFSVSKVEDLLTQQGLQVTRLSKHWLALNSGAASSLRVLPSSSSDFCPKLDLFQLQNTTVDIVDMKANKRIHVCTYICNDYILYIYTSIQAPRCISLVLL